MEFFVLQPFSLWRHDRRYIFTAVPRGNKVFYLKYLTWAVVMVQWWGLPPVAQILFSVFATQLKTVFSPSTQLGYILWELPWPRGGREKGELLWHTLQI